MSSVISTQQTVHLCSKVAPTAHLHLQVNLTRMGRAVLPASEQILFALNWLYRHLISRKVAPYVPDFKQAFDHFCLHAGELLCVMSPARILVPSGNHSRITHVRARLGDVAPLKVSVSMPCNVSGWRSGETNTSAGSETADCCSVNPLIRTYITSSAHSSTRPL